MNNFLRFILIISFCFIFMHPCFANAQDMFNLSSDGSINVNINNKPLNEVLRSLSSRFSIELKGYSVGNEVVNLNLSNISLDDMLKRMLRGYNYVFIKPDRSQKSVLMVLSKVERTKYVDAPPAAAPPPPAVAAPPVQQPMVTPIPSPQPSPVQSSSQDLSVTQTPTPSAGGVLPSGTRPPAEGTTTGDRSSATSVNESPVPPK